MGGTVRVSMTGKSVTVEVCNPGAEYENVPSHECLGWTLASLAGCIGC